MKEILIVSLLGIAILAADILKLRKLIFPISIIGLLGLIASCVIDWGHNEIPFAENGGMLLFDNFALAFTLVLAVIALFWFVLTRDSFSSNSGQTDIYALILFSLCGAVIMVSYTNVILLFLGIEILSIPLYVLAASDRKNILSNEAGFKYFFLGSFASAILLFGLALVYGATGSFDIYVIAEKAAQLGSASSLLVVGSLLIFIGFAFKVSVAPFHLWAPDVYQGSPTVITAFMATIVKAAAFGGMYRIFSGPLYSFIEDFNVLIAILSGLTLILANAIATRQQNSKRLLAYSSISHAGFMMGGIMMCGSFPAKYLLYYILTYSLASLTAFAIFQKVSAKQNGLEEIDAFKGLVRRNPLMASAMTIALFSMAGIPPMSGFMAKYFVISEVLSGGYLWLVIIMILSSVVAMYYYLKLIIAMFSPIENAGRMVISTTQKTFYILLSALMILLFFGAAFLEVIAW